MELENKTITITEAITRSNSMSTNSRLTGKQITFGKIVHKRDDGLFFENVTIDGAAFRPFYRYADNTLDLDPINSKKKSITIKKFTL